MLKTETRQFHKVLFGQSVEAIAAYYSLSPYLLARENDLTEEPAAGRILKIPKTRGNRYTVREGDTKALLCGSEERFLEKNGTEAFYIGMKITL